MPTCRQNGPRQNGNSIFVDDDLRPYDDQWRFLANIGRMSRSEVADLVGQASAGGRILGVRLPIDDDNEEPWLAPPSRRKTEPPNALWSRTAFQPVIRIAVGVDRLLGHLLEPLPR
jgi:hypothetical protein